ncbi:SDR family NAD(P)-dependent oxidoreductase [Mycolicibacterium sp. XJ879]
MNNSCACHNVSERVVLITGGSRGLGRHMAFAMAAHGAHVIIASRDEASCSATAAEIERATGRAVMPYGAHVGRWDQIEGLVEAAYAQFGRVDVLINNAGMSPTYASLPEVTEKLFDAVLNVNLKGPFRLAALVGQRMVREGRGSIINVSSTASIRPRPDVVPYAAAKAGLNAMTEALALAYGPTVRVNTLMAGPFRTDATAQWDPEATAKLVAGHSLRRLGDPDEVVGAALFLASEASSYTTGSIVRADGGIP